MTFRTQMLCSTMRALSQENTGYKPRAKSAVVSPKMAGMEIVAMPMCCLAFRCGL